MNRNVIRPSCTEFGTDLINDLSLEDIFCEHNSEHDSKYGSRASFQTKICDERHGAESEVRHRISKTLLFNDLNFDLILVDILFNATRIVYLLVLNLQPPPPPHGSTDCTVNFLYMSSGILFHVNSYCENQIYLYDGHIGYICG